MRQSTWPRAAPFTAAPHYSPHGNHDTLTSAASGFELNLYGCCYDQEIGLGTLLAVSFRSRSILVYSGGGVLQCRFVFSTLRSETSKRRYSGKMTKNRKPRRLSLSHSRVQATIYVRFGASDRNRRNVQKCSILNVRWRRLVANQLRFFSIRSVLPHTYLGVVETSMPVTSPIPVSRTAREPSRWASVAGSCILRLILPHGSRVWHWLSFHRLLCYDKHKSVIFALYPFRVILVFLGPVKRWLQI